jgi:CheY-like chemotaxis protein
MDGAHPDLWHKVLPVAAVAGRPGRAEKAAMAALVAVINDNDDILELIRAILMGEEYRVITLAKDENPYQMVLREQPDLIVLDIRLGEADEGYHTLELLKLNPETAQIPVLVCTGDVLYIREKRDFLARKGIGVLEKPFDVEALLSGVAAGLDRQRHHEDRKSRSHQPSAPQDPEQQ